MLKRVLGSGWIPAVLVAGLAVGLVHRGGHVRLHDIVMFAGYVVGWLVLPGTICWRFVTARRGPRPLAEDLAFGALTGYVLEFPVYLLFLSLGHPHAYLVWPAIVALGTVTTARGRALWRPTGQAMPLRWTWSVSAVLAYVVVWFGHYVWGPSPVTTASLSTPYIDEPYHLSLAASLKHSLPPKVLFVDDTPLKYHWLSHLHVAASSWVTGIEPIVLLRALCIPTLILLVAVALAHAAARLSGVLWTGVIAVGALVVAPIDFSGWSNGGGTRLVSVLLMESPSAAFVNASLLLTVVLCLELLTGKLGGVRAWALTGLAMVAMLGAKSTSLPTVIAGLVVAAVVGSILGRRVDRTATGLAVLSVVAFVGATPLFFGAGSHGLNLDPFAYVSWQGELSRPAAALNALVFLSFLSTGAGVLALLLRGGWRRTDHLFLVATCASGIGAGLALHQQGYSEFYFVYVVFLPMLLGGALGLQRVAAVLPSRSVLRAGAAAFSLAAVAGIVLIAVDRPLDRLTMAGSELHRVLAFTLAPLGVALAIVVGAAAVVVTTTRRLRSSAAYAGIAVPVLILSFAGLGTAPALWASPGFVTNPWNHSDVTPEGVMGPGGIRAARWLRAHSATDALAATNAHCTYPRMDPCSARNFWMAGYSERQFLVEGWSYVAWESVGLHSPLPNNTSSGPFWAPQRLTDNDAAFTTPSASSLGRLRNHYGVQWLLVDRRYPVDLRALRALARVRFHAGFYTVLQLQ